MGGGDDVLLVDERTAAHEPEGLPQVEQECPFAVDGHHPWVFMGISIGAINNSALPIRNSASYVAEISLKSISKFLISYLLRDYYRKSFWGKILTLPLVLFPFDSHLNH